MSKYERITVTIPPEDLEAADQIAVELDRSRSWIVAEALRQFVRTHRGEQGDVRPEERQPA